MIHRHIQIRKTKNTGLGLFASKVIQKSEVIWSSEGLLSRHFTKVQLSTLDPQYASLSYWDGEAFTIDQDDPGNYMNHSCSPNTWWLRETLVARRNIHTGDEITYDYATTDIYGINGNDSLLCRCGSPHCRGTIYADDLLRLKRLRFVYRNHLPGYTKTCFSDHGVGID